MPFLKLKERGVSGKPDMVDLVATVSGLEDEIFETIQARGKELQKEVTFRRGSLGLNVFSHLQDKLEEYVFHNECQDSQKEKVKALILTIAGELGIKFLTLPD